MSKARPERETPAKLFWRTHWPTLRAALIGYFVVFNVLAALPSTGGASPDRFERPIMRAELERWSRFLRALGLDVDSARLGRSYLRFASAVEELRSTALSPIAWWFELTRTSQAWRLFGLPRERPAALSIAATNESSMQLLYSSRDERHRWRASLLEYRRVRAAYTPVSGRPPATYEGFAARIADEVFRERPRVERVNITLLESHTTLPGDPPDPILREIHAVERRRSVP